MTVKGNKMFTGYPGAREDTAKDYSVAVERAYLARLVKLSREAEEIAVSDKAIKLHGYIDALTEIYKLDISDGEDS